MGSRPGERLGVHGGNRRVGGQQRRQRRDGRRQGQQGQPAPLQPPQAHPTGPRPATTGELERGQDGPRGGHHALLRRGIAATRALVWGCRGRSSTVSGGPSSTMLPPCITATRSPTKRATARSWVTNRK